MKQIMNIVNFVRGIEPRWEMDLYTPVVEQIKYNKKYSIPNTFLLQYDAMRRQDFRDLFLQEQDDNMELGVWFENCRELIESVGLTWRGREGYDWDWFVNVGFLEGYTPAERELIIDEVFRLFQEIFGEYPKVAGSWLLDAYSMDYMCQKYDMKAFCICREQYAVDAYTLWGGYSSGGYYPSKNNMLCPAQTEENKISAPAFRMLMADPIYNYDGEAKGYGVCTLEPAWKNGQDSEITDWYFDAYYKTPCLTHAQATTGQENSFGWDMFGEGYCMQVDKLVKLQAQGIVSLQKLGDTGLWYQKRFSMSAATAQVAEQDWRGTGQKTVWYNCKNYRANLHFSEGKLWLRDLTKFDDRYQERYLHKPCEGWIATYDNLPIVESRLWNGENYVCAMTLSKQAVNIYSTEQSDTTLCVKVSFADGGEGSILFAEEGICFDHCGDIVYQWGMPGKETKLTLNGDKLCGCHNGFAYQVGLNACIEKQPGGVLLKPQNGRVALQMDIRKA